MKSKNTFRLSESRLRTIVRESVEKILKENSSSKLYHFINFDSFENIARTNSFTPSDTESAWHNGKNTMSFSRTKSFREGWPTVMYSGYDKGDDWCAIRLTIDGDLFNQKPNFKIDGKQYNISVKPFDWAYKDMDDGDPYSFADNYGGIFAHNGKEWMMQSDDYIEGYIPINYGKKSQNDYKFGTSYKQGHPYSQAEDRLTTYAKSIPNASQFITRVDILLLPYAFNNYNREDRERLYGIITSSCLSGKIHIYDKIRNLELGNETNADFLKKVLLTKDNDRRFKSPFQKYTDNPPIKQDF